MRTSNQPALRFATAALLAGIGALLLPGCQLGGAPKLTPDELRTALLADHQAKLEQRAVEVRVQSPPTEFESSLERILKQAQEDGVALPEDRRTVKDNLAAADKMSGADAYKDAVLDVGRDLVDAGEAASVVLGLREAVRKAFEHNIDLNIARFGPKISEQQITQAQAVFDTVLFGGVQWGKLDTPRPPGVIPGLSGDQQSESLALQTGIRQTFETGGTFTATALAERLEQNPSFFGVRSYYDADVIFQLTQPLLRGFGRDVTRANIELAGIAQQSEAANLRAAMIDLAVAVEQGYWQLVTARQVLAIQQGLYERTIKVRDKLEPRFGFDLLLADLNEVNARIDQRYADVLRARQNVRRLSDQLKRLINDPDLPVIDEAVLAPADTPTDSMIAYSLLDQVTTALQHRPEIETALLRISDADVRRVVADNAQLPILNLTAASTFSGLDVDSFDEAVRDVADVDYIDYALGVEFERPLGNRSARALFEQRTLERQQALENYRLQAQVVTLEVKDAMRAVDTNYQLIATTRSQRRASALSLEVAEIQLEKGGRNEAETFTTRVDRVLARQDALAQAEAAEVQALSDYMIAISELHRATGTSLEQAGVEVDTVDD